MRPSDLPVEDLLLQLGEESGELSQATAKYIRKMRGNNPTPKSDSECFCAVLDEVVDVQVAIAVLLRGLGVEQESLEPRRQRKLARWQERLSQS